MGSLAAALLLLAQCLLGPPSVSGRPTCQRCDEHKVCDCSEQKLLQMPALPIADVLGLNVSYNYIEAISELDCRSFLQLRALSLQGNRIHSIHERAFTSLANLQSLDLSYNQLSDLSPSWFFELSLLQHLNLLGNTYQTLGQGLLFLPLASLRSLQFGGPAFQAVGGHDFDGIQQLGDLVMDGNELLRYEEGSFGYLRSLDSATVSLRGPFVRDHNLTSCVLRDLSSSKTHLTLTDLKLTDAESMRPLGEFGRRGGEMLTFRNVSMTDEAVVTFILLLGTSRLTYLGVEDSQLAGHGQWSKAKLVQPKYLHTLFIRNIQILDFYAFSSLTYFQNLLNATTRVTIINSKVFLIPCNTSRNFRHVEFLDLSDNLLTDSAMKESACHGDGVWRELQVLNLTKNSLRSIGPLSQLFTRLVKLTCLQLSLNLFSEMPRECHWPPNLQTLNLSSCQIRTLTPCVPKSLHVLDLSNNALSVFSVTLPLLTELRLSGNKFVTLPEVRLLPSLAMLSLRGNKLIRLTKSGLQAHRKLTTLEAGDNNYVCSCEFVAFVQQDLLHMVRLPDWPQSYMCDSPTALRGVLVRDARHSVFECHMTAVVAVLCTGVTLTFLVVGTLCYKLHAVWYLRMSWAWIRAKRKPAAPQSSELCYDAFVSYSERDSEWVENYLVAELESVLPPFKLCLHKRDFLPGKWIMDNIINSIEQSRKTLFVLSRHFVSSEWCKYELDFSHFRLFDESTDTAVLILLEPIPKETIPKRFCKLRQVMNSRTYLEWPEDEELRPIFWYNLKLAIKNQDCTAD